MNNNPTPNTLINNSKFKFDDKLLQDFIEQSQEHLKTKNPLDLWLQFSGLFDPVVRMQKLLSNGGEVDQIHSHSNSFLGIIFHRNQKLILDCYKQGASKELAIEIENLVNDLSEETAIAAIKDVRTPEVPGISKTDAILDFILGCFIISGTQITTSRWLNIIQDVYNLQPYSSQPCADSQLHIDDELYIDEIGLKIIAQRNINNFDLDLDKALNHKLIAKLMVLGVKDNFILIERKTPTDSQVGDISEWR